MIDIHVCKHYVIVTNYLRLTDHFAANPLDHVDTLLILQDIIQLIVILSFFYF